MKRVYSYFFCIPAIFFFAGHIAVNGQISIAPTALYIHDNFNIASLQVTNGRDMAREVSVSFKFGYPSCDSIGRLIMVYDDTLSESRYGLGGRLRAFPRHFELQPGGQQVIRVQVLPLSGKPDGVYWSRMVISSGETAEDIDGRGNLDGIGTRINYVFKQNIAVFYRKGEVETGLSQGEVSILTDKGSLVAEFKLKPAGNSPFNGTVTTRLFNEAGDEVAFYRQTLAIYFEVLQRIEMELPKESLPSGNYTLRFSYETKRNDIPESDLVQCPAVEHNVPVVIK